MSFYGNIINYVSEGIQKIQVGDNTYEPMGEDGIIDLTPGLDLSYNLSIETVNDNTDNNLVYLLKQNNQEMGRINIPLDLILSEAKVETYEVSGAWGAPGIYIHLVFKTSETYQQDVYIDVKELNKVSGESSNTIIVEVDNNQTITANLTQQVQTLLNYIDTEQNISTYVDEKVKTIQEKIPTELGVMSVKGSNAIEATGTTDISLSLKLNDEGNVQLSQDATGLKAEINLQDYVKKSDLPEDGNIITTIVAGEHMGEITDNGTNNNHAYVINGKNWSNDIAEIEIFNTDILTVNALGGIKAGEDLDGLTTRQILNKLLFPYVAQVVDAPSRIPSNTVLEKGNTQKITSVTVKVTKKSEVIRSVALYNGSTKLAEKTGGEVAAGGTFTFYGLNVAVPSTNVVLTVKVTDASGNVVSKNTAGWTFVYPYYYGVCADGAIINEALVEGLTKKIETKGNKTDWSFTCNNQCIVFAYPKTYGVLNKIVDPNNFDITGSFARHEVSITGLDGTTQAYYVYVNGASTVTDFKVDFNY